MSVETVLAELKAGQSQSQGDYGWTLSRALDCEGCTATVAESEGIHEELSEK